MSLSIGIVGLPNVGKSTLFNALLKKQQALAANYPFATIEPNVGVVPVPDTRLNFLAEIIANPNVKIRMIDKTQFVNRESWPPIVPATVTFTDIAGIVKGASQGEGLGNKFLAHIREADAICMVLRAFADENVVLTGSGDPVDDRQVLMTELILADMQTVENKLAKSKLQTSKQKLLEKIRQGLNQGMWVSQCLGEEELGEIKDLWLLTAKPVIYVINVDEAELGSGGDLVRMYAQKLGVIPASVVIVSAKIEAELAEMDEVEQREYLQTLGLAESGLERLVKVGYGVLGLQSFLTAGEKEVRAWTIKRGTTAVEAAGVIHTDFVKKFIKAEIITFEDFVAAGGWKRARETGRVRLEGRDYVMQEGDVVEFKIGG